MKQVKDKLDAAGISYREERNRLVIEESEIVKAYENKELMNWLDAETGYTHAGNKENRLGRPPIIKWFISEK